MELNIQKSNSKNKRLKAIITDKMGQKKTIQFGAKGGSTYIDHEDKNKRKNYIKRHKALGEDWNKINAGSLSRFILWGDTPNIGKNIKLYEKRFL